MRKDFHRRAFQATCGINHTDHMSAYMLISGRNEWSIIDHITTTMHNSVVTPRMILCRYYVDENIRNAMPRFLHSKEFLYALFLSLTMHFSNRTNVEMNL